MKVLHLGILHSPNLAISRAFRERDHDITEYDCRGTKDINGVAVREVTGSKYDLVFMQIQGPGIITAETCDTMRSSGALTVLWNGDVRSEEEIAWTKALAAHVDITSFTNETDNDIIRSLGYRAEYLQIGYDDLIYNDRGAAKRSGIVFAGNNYNSRFPQSDARSAMVDRMKTEFGDTFKVYGNGWGGKSEKHLSPDQEAQMYRQALIAIGMDHYIRPYFASDRLLRSQACGAMVLQQHYPGIAHEHPHVPYWNTVDQLVRMCREALDASDYYEFCVSMGKSQAQHVRDNHRWNNRVEKLEQWVIEHKQKKA